MLSFALATRCNGSACCSNRSLSRLLASKPSFSCCSSCREERGGLFVLKEFPERARAPSLLRREQLLLEAFEAVLVQTDLGRKWKGLGS